MDGALTASDVFRLTIERGQTVTYVAEIASERLPRMHLWKPVEYEQKQREKRERGGGGERDAQLQRPEINRFGLGRAPGGGGRDRPAAGTAARAAATGARGGR